MRARIKAVMVTGTASWARAKEGEDTGVAEAMAMVGQAVVEVQERVKKVEGWAVGMTGDLARGTVQEKGGLGTEKGWARAQQVMAAQARAGRAVAG